MNALTITLLAAPGAFLLYLALAAAGRMARSCWSRRAEQRAAARLRHPSHTKSRHVVHLPRQLRRSA